MDGPIPLAETAPFDGGAGEFDKFFSFVEPPAVSVRPPAKSEQQPADQWATESLEPVIIGEVVAKKPASEFRLPPPPTVERARWYCASERALVREMELPGPVRVAFDKFSGDKAHPSTIAAWLPIEFRTLTGPVKQVESWELPTYKSLSPAERGIYLRWLASGRQFEVPIKLALLFFSGLESRVLEQGPRGLSSQEREELVAVIQPLVDRYSQWSSPLRRHGINLIAFLGAIEAKSRTYLEPVPEMEASFDIPVALNVAVGQAARDQVPIPARWVLAFMTASIYALQRVAVKRCPQELLELFELRYPALQPEGLVLSNRTKRLLVTYSFMSDGRTAAPKPATTEVASAARWHLTESQLAPLAEAAQSCAESLAVYSRFLGREPEARGTPDADVRLPRELFKRRFDSELTALRKLAKTSVPVAIEDASEALWGRVPSRKDSVPLLQTLLEDEGVAVAVAARRSKKAVGADAERSQPARAFVLDYGKLEQIRRDDATSSKLLASLFTENDGAVASPPLAASTIEIAVGQPAMPALSLDTDHLSMLRELLGGVAWTQDALQELATRYDLMLDGALEQLNDVALDVAGAPLLEDGETQLDLAVASVLRENLGLA